MGPSPNAPKTLASSCPQTSVFLLTIALRRVSGGRFDGVGGCMRWIARGGVGRNHVAGGKVQTGVRSGRPATRTDWRGPRRAGWLEASEESEVEGDHRGPDISLEVVEATPGASRQ